MFPKVLKLSFEVSECKPLHTGGADFSVTGKGFDPTVGGVFTAEGNADANSAKAVQAGPYTRPLFSST